MMQVHGGYNGFSWFNDAIPSNDVQFYNTPFYRAADSTFPA